MKNRMAKPIQRGVAILAMALTAVLLFAGCAPAPTVEEGKVVDIGAIAPLTGPVATAGQSSLGGQLDYIRYFNEEQSIPGVTLKVIWIDSGLDPVRKASGFHRLMERGVVALLVCEAGTGLESLVEKNEMPTVVQGITESAMYPPSWMYGVFPTEGERFAVMADWIMENWKEARPPRITLVGPDVEYSRENEATSKRYAESIGMEWLPPEFVPYVSLDSTVQLLRLSARGADFVYVGHTWPVAVPVLKDADRLGLVDEITFCLWDGAVVGELVDMLGPTAQGLFGPKMRPVLSEVDNPGVAWARELWSKYYGTKPIETMQYQSISHAPPIPQAIKIAIEKVGYENLDGRAVKEALDTLEDFDPHGFGTPFTYTDPEVRRGSPWVRVYQIQGTDLVPVSDWREAPVLRPVP
jgi:branched-chain amino acid transport system substrate-binding protein